MDDLTIANVDAELKRRLRAQALIHGKSIEEEAADILRAGLIESHGMHPPARENLADAIGAIVRPLGGIELVIEPREAAPQPPRFD